MKRTKSVVRILTISSAFSFLALTGAGCLNGIGETLSSLLGIDILGVNPSASFGEDGLLDLSTLARNDDGDVQNDPVTDEDCDVTVTDEDGVEHDCQWVDDEVQPGSGYSAITLLIDGSGSMEVTYPEEEYGDFCLTCPHDPDRIRVQASQDFIGIIGEQAPDTVMGVMSFGPEPTPGWNVTQVLSDFTNDIEGLSSAVEQVAGDEQAGTPLYDSLAEIILATDESADVYAQFLRQTVVDGNNNDVVCDPSEAGEGDTIVVDGNNNTVVCQCDPTDTVVVDGNNNTVVCESDSEGGVEPEPGDDVEPEPVDEDPVFEGDVRRIILVLSDGEDLNSTEYDLEAVIALANQNDITVHAVGLGPASASFEDPRMQLEDQTPAILALQRLAEETGGIYASVHDADALRGLYQDIAAGLTEGYNRTGYACEDPEAFTSGERVEGTAVCNGQPEAFSFIVP